MHAYVSAGHLSIGWHVVALVIGLLAMKLSAMDTETLERLLAHAVVDALHLSGLSRKEAADLMLLDYHQFCRQLRAERGAHLSLTRLMRLCGTRFWLFFGPSLMLLVARDGYANIADTLLFIGRRRYEPLAETRREVHDEQRRA